MPSGLATSAELPFLDLDFSPRQHVRFSYSSTGDPLLKKAVIRAVEVLSGQRFLKKSYLAWSVKGHTDDTIFAAGIRALNIALQFDQAAHAAIPTHGPLLVVANHPFGVADGLALGDIITRARPDTKIMTHSLLCQPPEASRYVLPVDFGGTAEARQKSARTRMEAVQWLKDGHCIALFPAGGVATRQRPMKGPALDLPWHPFVSKLAAVAGTNVLPVFFHGQNSTLFHLASHTYYPLRIALLFRETLRQWGESVKVSIGAPMAATTLPHKDGRHAVAEALRALTFALAKDETASATPYNWPKHVTF
jgi:putative hemolysin